MGVVKGMLEVTLSLNKSTCYFMKTGKCSLNVVADYAVSGFTKTAPNDLLYCPRLYRAMRSGERMKPILIIPCECGHAEVVSGNQRACIAGQKGLELAMEAADPDVSKESCCVCGGQITFEKNSGGNRIVAVKAVIQKEKDK